MEEKQARTYDVIIIGGGAGGHDRRALCLEGKAPDPFD